MVSSPWLGICALSIVVLTGCGSGGEEAPTSQTKSPVASLAGNYTRSITKNDIAAVSGASLAGPPQGLPTGKVSMRITSENSVEFTFSDGGYETGTLELMGNDGDFQITTTGFCEHPKPGQYTEALAGDVLTVQRVHDDHCPDRAAALAGRWTQSP